MQNGSAQFGSTVSMLRFVHLTVTLLKRNGSAQFQNMSNHFSAFLMLVGLHSHYDCNFEKIVFFFCFVFKGHTLCSALCWSDLLTLGSTALVYPGDVWLTSVKTGRLRETRESLTFLVWLITIVRVTAQHPAPPPKCRANVSHFRWSSHSGLLCSLETGSRLLAD